MKTIVFVIVFNFIFVTLAVADPLEQSRIELEAQKKIHVSNSVKLSASESNQFWGVYSEYERDLGRATSAMFDLIRKFSEGYQNNSISDQNAANMLAEFFRIEAQKLQVKQSYLSRFQAILPNKKVLQFYQIDNKVDTLIRCDVAKRLPLIKTE